MGADAATLEVAGGCPSGSYCRIGLDVGRKDRAQFLDFAPQPNMKTMKTDPRSYFIVKHNLAALEAMPNFIWRTGESRKHLPRGFRQVKEGDRWIGFAYTTSGARERSLSLVTGFYECMKEAFYGIVPRRARDYWSGDAWMIKGRPLGRPLGDPVVIPPISSFLGRPLFAQTTITRISRKEFDGIERYTRTHWLPRADIPCLGRDPRSEQELVAVVATSLKKLGIERIDRLQTGFPDMLVKLKGKADPVHLELESYSTSFLSHHHSRQVRKRCFKGTPVGLLCWINNGKGGTLKRYVHRVFELRSLLRNGKPLRWP